MSDKTQAQLVAEANRLRQEVAELKSLNRQLQQAEQAQQQRSQYLEALFEHALDTILVADDQANYVDANPAAGQLLGYSREELLTLSLKDITPDDEYLAGLELWQEFSQTGVQQGRYALRRKNGDIVITEYRAVSNFVPGRHLSVMRDITNRVQAESNLRESLDFNQAVLNSLPAHMVVLDRSGIILSVNEDWQQFGAQNNAPSSLCAGVGLNYLEVCRTATGLDADLARQCLAGLEAVLSGAQASFDLEYPCDSPTQKRWFLLRAVPLRHPQGGLVISHTDITHQRRADERLRYQANLLENVSDAIIATDLNFVITSWNKAAEQIYGWAAEVALGHHMRALIPIEYSTPQDNATARQALLETGFWQGEVTQTRINGEQVHILASVTLVKDQAGQPMGAVAVNRDITERKQTEKMLGVALEKYRVLFETFPLGITISDEAGRIVESNRTAERLLGLPQAEHEQRRLDDPKWQLIRPDGSPMPPAEYAAVRALQENRLVENIEMGILKGEGQVTWLNVTAAPIPLEGYGVAITYGDITDRKQAQAASQLSEERFRTSAENMLDGFSLLLPIRDKAGQIIDFRFDYINKTGCLSNGRSCQDHYDHTLLELLPPIGEIGLLAEYAAVAETAQPLFREVLRYGGNGEGAPRQLLQAYEVQVVKLGDGLAVTWRDILTRKRAEEQVRYQANLLENVSDAVIATDLELIIRSWNRAAETIYGWTAAEAIGQTMPLLLKPEHLHGEQVEEIMAIVTENGRWQGEVQVHRKDGTQLYVQISISLIYDYAGQPVGTVGVNRDVTEQRRIEAALQKTEERLYLALQNSPIVLFSQDQELRYTWVYNPVASLATDDVVGKTDDELLPPDEAAVLTGLKQQVLATGRSEQREVKVSPGPETSLYYDLFVEPLRDAVGAVVGVNCVATDITRLKQVEAALREANETLEERVQERTAELAKANDSLSAEIIERERIEENLRQSEEVFRQLTENIRETFFIYEIESGRLLYISQSAEHLWGLSLERLQQNFRVFLEITHPDDRERITNSLNQLPHENNRIFDEEFRMWSPQGDVRWAWVRTFPIRNEAGEIYRVAGLIEDITERKRAEKLLRASEEKYRQLVDLAKEGIWTIDVEARTTFVNPRMVEMLGYTEEEMLGRPLFDFMDEQDVKLARENIERRMRGIREQHDFEFRRKDGTRLYASLEATPLADEQGQYNGALAMVSDITTRRLAEDALRASEESLRAILSATTDTIFLMDVEGTVLTMNEASARRLNATVEDIIGRNIYDFIPADVGESRKKRVDEVLRTGQPVNFIDHRWDVWIDQTVYPIFDVNGQEVIRLAVFAQDITARKQAEEDLLRQLKHTALLSEIARATTARLELQSLFQIALEQLETQLPVDFSLIALRDAGNEALTIIACGRKSHARCSQLGLSAGQSVLLQELGAENWLHRQQTLHYYPELTQFDHPLAIRLGQEGLRAVVVLPLLTLNNGPLGLLILGREPANAFIARELEFLTEASEHLALAIQHIHLYQELHSAYEDLRQSQESILKVERLRALGQMASGIAHDINNALVPILGFTEVLLLRNPDMKEEARRYLEHIKLAGEDISRVVNRMREFYRPRSEQEPLVSVDLNQIVPQVIELTRPQWRDIPQEQAISITVETDLAAGLPQIKGIESELRQALTNLIINAVQAMPQGGTITLRTRPLNGRLTAEVIDTGTGMDEETRRRCLEPFFTTKGQQGSGLGLSMVYGVMQRHNGSIEIDSVPGQGTTICLLFPVYIETGPDRAGEAISEPVVPALRILCVDDDPRIRALLDELLTYDGHRPTLADGGEAGIKLFQEALAQGQPFDVVMTDLGMPHVGGREVARAVKQSAPKTPVILLSGWGRQMQDRYDLPPGVDAVLSKPVTISVIREALAQTSRKDLP